MSKTNSNISNQRKRSIKQKKSTKKAKLANSEELVDNSDTTEQVPRIITSDALESIRKTKLTQWKNRNKILVFSSRNNNSRVRHLIHDLISLLPHSKAEVKLEKSEKLTEINEICQLRNCKGCIFFEVKKKTDTFIWFSSIPDGPSFKFLLENIHTTEELKLTGNCLKGSRHILSFDKSFLSTPVYTLVQEMFTQLLSVPCYHPKSKPFIDHALNFSILDNKIWFRNYQILERGSTLLEIGPRFVLTLIKVFEGSFCGSVLYSNPHYVAPNMYRSMLQIRKTLQHKTKVNASIGKAKFDRNRQKRKVEKDPLDIFN